MSGEILLRAPEARDLAAEMKTASNEAKERFEAMRTRLNQLAESFRGQAATAFDTRYQEWNNGARQVVDALDSLGQWLQNAAQTIEDTDAHLAGGLG